MAGFVALTVISSLSGILAVQALSGARRDLVVLTRGYLALGRSATQLRTLQELRDLAVDRAVQETDPGRRRALASVAKDLSSGRLRELLDELSTLSRQLQQSRAAQKDALFLENIFAQARRARVQARAYDDATDQLLEVLQRDAAIDDDPDALALLDDDDLLDRDTARQTRLALVETWRRRSEAASRELRTIALGVDARALDALVRIERAEERSAALVAIAIGVSLLVAVLILWMMLRALRPLRVLASATRSLRAGEDPDAIQADLAVPGRLGSDTEVGLLADELVGLAQALKERGSALEQQRDALARLRAFAENIIRSVRVGIIVVDDTGAVRTINPAARSVFSIPLKDVEDRPLAEVAASFDVVIPLVQEVRESGALRARPLVTVGPHIVDITLVPLRDRAGEHSGEVLILGEDVTQREEARERLLHSERLAAIGRLAAQITHEIRNPLSSIGLNMELLEDDVENLPEERREEVSAILEAVLSEVRRLTEITEGYLRFARLPAPTKQSRDVGDVCADLVAFFQEEAAQRGINIELHVEDDLPAVDVDADRLRQALLNLLRNGADAVERGGTVRLSVRAAVDDGAANGVADGELTVPAEGGLEIVVSDNGPGIDDDTADRLFSPFFTTKREGTGLGLVVAREIAREHGGELSVRSRGSRNVDDVLSGAAFCLRLPRVAEAN